MCKECKCNKTAIGGTPENLTGKPTATPTGLYKGVGGTK